MVIWADNLSESADLDGVEMFVQFYSIPKSLSNGVIGAQVCSSREGEGVCFSKIHPSPSIV